MFSRFSAGEFRGGKQKKQVFDEKFRIEGYVMTGSSGI